MIDELPCAGASIKKHHSSRPAFAGRPPFRRTKNVVDERIKILKAARRIGIDLPPGHDHVATSPIDVSHKGGGTRGAKAPRGREMTDKTPPTAPVKAVRRALIAATGNIVGA